MHCIAIVLPAEVSTRSLEQLFNPATGAVMKLFGKKVEGVDAPLQDTDFTVDLDVRVRRCIPRRVGINSTRRVDEQGVAAVLSLSCPPCSFVVVHSPFGQFACFVPVLTAVCSLARIRRC